MLFLLRIHVLILIQDRLVLSLFESLVFVDEGEIFHRTLDLFLHLSSWIISLRTFLAKKFVDKVENFIVYLW